MCVFVLPGVNFAEAPQPAGSDSAWYCICCHVRLWGVMLLGLTIDLVSKHLAFRYLPASGRVSIIEGIVSLDRSLNLGALFGIGKGMTGVFILASVAAVAFVLYMFWTSRRGQWVTHVGLALVLAGALGNLYDRLFVHVDVVSKDGVTQFIGVLTPEQKPGTVRLGHYPGASGIPQQFSLRPRADGKPLYELETGRSAVRDFIRVDISLNTRWTGKLPVWPWIFNVADSMLVVGVSLLLIIYWRHPAASGRSGKGSV